MYIKYVNRIHKEIKKNRILQCLIYNRYYSTIMWVETNQNVATGTSTGGSVCQFDLFYWMLYVKYVNIISMHEYEYVLLFQFVG